MMTLSAGRVSGTLSPLAILFSFLTVFFNTFDDIGIERELFLARLNFYLHCSKKCEPSSFFNSEAASRAGAGARRCGCCGFKTCHQANYVFMKEVEQISG